MPAGMPPSTTSTTSSSGMHFPRDYREQGLHVINLGCWEKYPSCAVLDASGGMTLKMLER